MQSDEAARSAPGDGAEGEEGDAAEGENGGYGKSTSKPRWALSDEGRRKMEAVYFLHKFPPVRELERLCREVNGSMRQIKVWFQNRRQRQKPAQGEDDAAGGEGEAGLVTSSGNYSEVGVDASCREALLGNAQAAREEKARASEEARECKDKDEEARECKKL